jgi:hypothetical protein
MSDRLEREIEEIFDKIEHFPSPESRRARAQKRYFKQLGSSIGERQRAIASQLGRISISQVLLISFLLILGSLFFRRFNPAVAGWVLVAGVILFITSFAILVFTRGSSTSSGPSGSPQRWRGREIEAGHYARQSPIDRLRRWWDMTRARRR